MATVLVVDDRAINRELVRTLLGYQGHKTTEATDGASALQAVRRERPDVMITDVLMPKMDGYDLVRELRADPSTASLPVIFYTANYLEEEARPMAEALGVTSVVTKSGDLAALLHAVHAALTAPAGNPTAFVADDFSREHLRLLNTKLVDKIRELEEKERLHDLVAASATVGEDLSVPATLQRIVAAARSLVSARYAAVRVAIVGDTVEFAQVGSVGPAHGDSASVRPASMSVAIHLNNELRGSLQLADPYRGGEFSDGDRSLVKAFANAAAVAIINAQLYDEARRRQAWLSASAQITSALVAAEPSEALELVVRGARRVAEAAVAWIEIPTEGHTVTIAACDGSGCAALRGRRWPHSVPRQELFDGQLMAIPLTGATDHLGALVLGTTSQARPFVAIDVEMATTFAGHASLALEFARAEAARRRLVIVEDRDRIARDLHDVVIQRLFGIGLRLDGFGTKLPAAEAEQLRATIGELDETMDEIRNTIFSLRAGGDGASLRAQLLKVTAQALPSLGFRPQLKLFGPIDTVVPERIRADIVATVCEALSNTARHAAASVVSVALRAAEGELVLEIQDNGRGLVPGPESGLANLRQRAAAHGGQMCTTAGTDGVGLRIVWRVPICAAADDLISTT